MTPDEMRALIERYIAAYNAIDIEGMLALMRADVAFENYSDGELNLSAAGIEELRRIGERTRGIFSSRRQTVTAISFEEDRAVVDIAYEAVLAVDLENGMKAGDAVAFAGRSIFTFADGRIAALADYA